MELFNKSAGVNGIAIDSREDCTNKVYICIRGHHNDGHNYIQEAISNGAKVVIVDKKYVFTRHKGQAEFIIVENTKKELARLSAKLYDNPFSKLTSIAITGTKGKTTTAQIIHNILEHCGKKVGVIGTLGIDYPDGTKEELINTTPNILKLQESACEMVNMGCEVLVMEVSSQGLKDDRVCQIEFDYGIFTNIYNDHIGEHEHEDFDEYLFWKSQLFHRCKTAIINIDAEYSSYILNACNSEKTYGYGLHLDELPLDGYLSGEIREADEKGVKFCTNGVVEECFEGNSIGEYTVYNCMAAILVTSIMSVGIENILCGIKSFQVKGRMERIQVDKGYSVYIDYAHNAESTKNVISNVKKYCKGNVIALFGCGGNRSKTRRYEMGYMSGQYADISIITEDNSRWESPYDIINDIKIGIDKTQGAYVIIKDRREAIRYCLDIANDNDVILLLGKGHETYQEIQGVRYELDEKKIVLDHLKC